LSSTPDIAAFCDFSADRGLYHGIAPVLPPCGNVIAEFRITLS